MFRSTFPHKSLLPTLLALAAVVATAEPAVAVDPPFPRRVAVDELPEGLTWINTTGPLRLADLRGKFVVLDFWTYCCINCMHVLPELEKLEQAYPNEVVVIGVHSAKFDAETSAANIREAVLRYDIAHPVVNDAGHEIWNQFGVSSWPTLMIIDPEGYAVFARPGEFKFDQIDALLKKAIPYYRQRKLLDETPVRFDLLAHHAEPTPLRFPGKVLADPAGERLFIADSGHHRIVVASLDGKLIDTIGSGKRGRTDGSFDRVAFNDPQGMALRDQALYVADTKNHAIRKIDLAQQRVATIAGTGRQSNSGWPGIERARSSGKPPKRWIGRPRTTDLASPWALWIHQDALFIAMAGPHQIWRMALDESEIGPYAGNGREDIVDGPLLPRLPYQLGFSSFAQPSGLASDGKQLYVADSEGSSIRAVPLGGRGRVTTVLGTSKLPASRLFTFGDQDGPLDEAQLQHPLGVVYDSERLYVVDTYNNKIKAIDLKSQRIETIAGAAQNDGFNEPAGITLAGRTLLVADTNNHRVRTIDLAAAGRVATLTIQGLAPPARPKPPTKPEFPNADQVAVRSQRIGIADGKIRLRLQLELPAGWKINPQAPMQYLVETVGRGPVDRQSVGTLVDVDPPANGFEIQLPVKAAGRQTLELSLIYYYCRLDGGGLCKVGSVVWTVPLDIVDREQPAAVELGYQVPD